MPAEHRGGDGTGPIGGHLAEDLARWAAEARADEAGGARARRRWLRRQAEEDATFSGLLVDLAERGATVVVRTVAGRNHGGDVVAVGADFALLRTEQRREVLLPFAAISSLRPGGSVTGAAAGHRAATVDLLLGEALEAMAGNRSRVAIAVAGERDVLAGEVEAVGDDLLTLRLDGPRRDRAFVRLAAVTEVGVAGR